MKREVDPANLNYTSTYTWIKNKLDVFKDPVTNQNYPTEYTIDNDYDTNDNLIQTRTTLSSGNTATTKLYYESPSSPNDVSRVQDPNSFTAGREGYKFSYDNQRNQITSIDLNKATAATKYNQYGNPVNSTVSLGVANSFVTNASFETATGGIPDSWTQMTSYDSGAISQDTTVKRFANASLKVVSSSTSSSFGYIAATQEINVQPNTTYTLSGYIKTSGLTGKALFNTYQMKADRTPATNPWISNSAANVAGTRDWTYRTLTFTTSSDAAKVRIYMEIIQAQQLPALPGLTASNWRRALLLLVLTRSKTPALNKTAPLGLHLAHQLMIPPKNLMRGNLLNWSEIQLLTRNKTYPR